MVQQRLGVLAAALLVALVVLPPAQAVKLYKWVDKNGNVSYHDRPPPSEQGYRVESKNFRVGETAAAAPQKGEGSNAAEQYPVVLYTAPQCTSCDLARAYLDKRNVPFTDKNVQGDAESLNELQQKTGSLTVPTIMVGSKVMKGYMESLLAGELDAAGYPKIETAPPAEAEQPQ
jgi:glutaredoxin